MRNIKITPSLIDHAVGLFSQKAKAERLQYKAKTALFLDGVGTTGYVVPGSPKRSMRGWEVAANHPDRDIIPALPGSRAGARDLFMNTPVAAGILRRTRTNAVGFGLNLQSRIDRDFLKLKDDAADEWERNVEREFKLWAKSTECDTRRTLNFYSMQGLALFSTLMSGDVFVMLPYIKRGNRPYELCIQLIEADFVSNPYNVMETSTVSGGVETDEWGAPVAYHVRRIPENYPILAQIYGMLQWLGTWDKIPAFGAKSGRKNVLHLMQVERPGQRRGMTMLAPVIERLKNLSRLTESELTAAVVTSFFTVFVKSSLPVSGLADSLIPEEKSTDPANIKSDKNLYEMGPGSMVELADGESIDTAAPKRPNGAFAPFFDALIKEIGAGVGIPYEQVMLCFQSSYSASRAAILEAWKFFNEQRHWLATYYCQPIYEEFLTEAITKGRVSAPGFFEDYAIRQAWTNSVWTGPGQGQINPKVETDAALGRIAGRLSTYEDEYTAIHGHGWEPAAHRLSRETKLLKDLDIMPTNPEKKMQPEPDASSPNAVPGQEPDKPGNAVPADKVEED